MSLKDLLNQSKLKPHKTNKEEIKMILHLINRDIQDALIKTLSEDLIFECHYADMLDHPQISLGIILRCHPTVLETRLKSRGYSDQKLRENGEAELLGASSSYMLEKQDLVKGNTLFEIDTTHLSIMDIANCIHEIIQHPSQHQKLKVGKISWLSDETIDLTRYTRTN